MSKSAIDGFHAVFSDPHRAARTWKERTGSQVVGCIGADVPFELITAAGMLPVRILGRPGQPTDRIAPYVGEGVDPGARSIAERLIDGTYDYVDHLVVCSTPILYGSLYEFLLESQRVYGDIGLPQPVLFDFFRSRRLTASLFDRETLKRFRALLETWSGSAIDDEALHASLRLHNQGRRLMAQVNALRGGDTPRLAGSDALAVMATSFLMPVEDHSRMMEELIAKQSELPAVEGVPVIYTGSNTENPDVYRAIEAGGAIIVADDQEFGSSAVEATADEEIPDPLDALCDRIQLGPPRAVGDLMHERADYLIGLAERSGAAAALFHILAIDHPAALDYPRLRDRLNKAGIPTTEYGPRRYHEPDFGPVEAQTRKFLSTLAAQTAA